MKKPFFQMFFQMSRVQLALASLVAILPGLVLVGCGGGGGGGGPASPTATPNPTNTPLVFNRVRVLLRDETGAGVDGLVTIGTLRRQSASGEVTFDNVPLGAQNVRVEVGTLVATQNFTAVSGTTTVTVTVRGSITATPAGTIPPPPPTPTPVPTGTPTSTGAI